jgi:hypothetical protein
LELAPCESFKFGLLLVRFAALPAGFTGVIFSSPLTGEDMSWASNLVDAFFAACLEARVLTEPADMMVPAKDRRVVCRNRCEANNTLILQVLLVFCNSFDSMLARSYDKTRVRQDHP